ncbi:VOC family protein [Macrococcoides caseolyticum]|uniref:VOC family protein n=1 Tax=Macrococcoides caseolyticum TaxID=69966 RepID=UPI001F39DEB8|nr:VOC family protein [Macrococcus caseolyticus]MCE4958023.1 VOC family protein [Macrococcus caseolyticus]
METKYFSNDTHVGAVHLNVNFMENSIKFYTEILGLKLIESRDDYAVIGTEKRPLIYLYQTNKARVNSAGLFHFALLVPSRAALGNIFFHLIKTEYPLAGASDHDVSEAIYLQDPEGNGIEIYRDLPSSEWRYEENGNIVMGTVEMDYSGVIAANNNAPFTGLHPDTIMGHMHLSVIDLHKSVTFYEDFFGMDTMTTYGPSASFLSAGGYHHHLGLNVWNRHTTPPEIDAPGLRYFDIHMPNTEDVEHFKKLIQEKGLETIKDGKSDIIKDPNGIGVRLMIQK